MIIGKLNQPMSLPAYFKFFYHSLSTVGGSGLYNTFTDSKYGKILSCDTSLITTSDARSSGLTFADGDYVGIFDTKYPIKGNANTIKTFSALLYSDSNIDTVDIYIGILRYHSGDSTLAVYSVNKITLNNIKSGYYHLITNPNIDNGVKYGNWYVNPNDNNEYYLGIWLPQVASKKLGVVINTQMNDNDVNSLYNLPAITKVLAADVETKTTLGYNEYNISSDIFYFGSDDNASIAMEGYDISYKETNNWYNLQVADKNALLGAIISNINSSYSGRYTVSNKNSITSSTDFTTISSDDTAQLNDYVNIELIFNSPLEYVSYMTFDLIASAEVLSDTVGMSAINIYVDIDGYKKFIDSVEITGSWNDFQNSIYSTDPCHFELYIGERNVSKVILEMGDSTNSAVVDYHINNFNVFGVDSTKFNDNVIGDNSIFDNSYATIYLNDTTLYIDTHDVLIKTVGYDVNNNIIGQSYPMTNRNK